MDTTTAYSWVPYFEKLADALLSYANNRQELIQKLWTSFKEHGCHLPKWNETHTQPADIDPFTLFASFNKKFSDDMRMGYAEAIASVVGIRNETPKGFWGVPLLTPQNANFYSWDNLHANSEEIDNLWKLFTVAIKYADTHSDISKLEFVKWFDIVERQSFIKWNITIGLYWIRPQCFINLDSLNRTFLQLENGIKEHMPDFKQVPDGSKYLEICHSCQAWVAKEENQYKTLPEISTAAYLAWENLKKAKKCWVMACSDGAQEYWQECFDNEKMLLGYGDIGDLMQYKDESSILERMNDVYKTGFTSSAQWPKWLWKFSHDIQPGDLVFAKSGTGNLKGWGVVTSGYAYNAHGLVDGFNHEIGVAWHKTNTVLEKDFFARMRTLQELKDPVKKDRLLSIIEQDDPPVDEDISSPTILPYTAIDFLHDVFMTEEKYAETKAALEYKYNIILQGPPGVGKSYAAKRLAYSLMGERDDERICMIQFHHSYSYEDFMQGYRPDKDGKFTLRNGIFYNFCKKAESSDKEYYLIIDEINRGDLNKIFGETFLLMEKDKRGTNTNVKLAYSQEPFSIPDNIRIIGMMNTADRSIALIDHALRRRFTFIDLEPAFGMAAFQDFVQNAPSSKLQNLLKAVISLNDEITGDSSLGKGYRIGHSYFCPPNAAELTDERLKTIVEFELIPLLEEYWFDEPDKVNGRSAQLREAVGLK